jgi:hypothetical protein
MIDQDIKRRYHDFRRIGVGGWVGHCAEYCLQLARAEAALDDAIEAGRVVWETRPDEDPDTSWMNRRQLKDYHDDRLWFDVFAIVRYRPNGLRDYLDCLGGIVRTLSGYDDDHVRLTRAEMAFNVRAELAELEGGVE